MHTSKIVKIGLSLLIFDYGVYPRHKISDYHTNELIQAIKSGSSIDPVVVDKNTKVIIDGFHRCTAYKKVYGLDYEVEVREIECADKAEMVIKSIELNNSHGLRLSAWDKARCISLLRAHEIKEVIIMKALSIPEDRYAKLKERIVPVKNKKGKVVREVELKRGQEKIAKKKDGTYVTEEEAEKIDSNKTTGQLIAQRIHTLIQDIDLNNFEITEKNYDLIVEFVSLLEKEIEKYEQRA